MITLQRSLTSFVASLAVMGISFNPWIRLKIFATDWNYSKDWTLFIALARRLTQTHMLRCHVLQPFFVYRPTWLNNGFDGRYFQFDMLLIEIDKMMQCMLTYQTNIYTTKIPPYLLLLCTRLTCIGMIQHRMHPNWNNNTVIKIVLSSGFFLSVAADILWYSANYLEITTFVQEP